MKTRKSSTDTFFIVSSVVGSAFAKALQEALRAKVSNKVLRVASPKGKNYFQVTDEPLDKVEQMLAFRAAGVSHPQFSVNDADEINSELIFARTNIRGTQGEGIVCFRKSDDEHPTAPLYVEYIPKQLEYRYHVFNGEVIDVQAKRKKLDFPSEDRNARIRNLGNGYVYCRSGVHHDDRATPLACAAVRAVGYVYGAVDIIYSKKRDSFFVLEVNSKPGLEGTTLEVYAEALIRNYQLNRS